MKTAALAVHLDSVGEFLKETQELVLRQESTGDYIHVSSTFLEADTLEQLRKKLHRAIDEVVDTIKYHEKTKIYSD